MHFFNNIFGRIKLAGMLFPMVVIYQEYFEGNVAKIESLK